MDYITLKDLSGELGIDRSHLRRYAIKLGIDPLRVRTRESQNQETLAVTLADADKIRQTRSRDGYNGGTVPASDGGGFYVIRLIPDLAPERVKFGFARDVHKRLLEHRTASPSAEIVGAWSCKQAWEPAALDALSDGGEWVGGEVYDMPDVDAVITKGNALFKLLLPDSTVGESDPFVEAMLDGDSERTTLLAHHENLVKKSNGG